MSQRIGIVIVTFIIITIVIPAYIEHMSQATRYVHVVSTATKGSDMNLETNVSPTIPCEVLGDNQQARQGETVFAGTCGIVEIRPIDPRAGTTYIWGGCLPVNAVVETNVPTQTEFRVVYAKDIETAQTGALDRVQALQEAGYDAKIDHAGVMQLFFGHTRSECPLRHN